jgi:DNA polymerase elongation subunit (family B)
MKLGYEFEILRGYLFERKNIFKEYIDLLYEMKANSSKGSADYIIYKLLQNSLYGRYGMNPSMEVHKIVDLQEVDKINKDHKGTNHIDLKNGKGLVSYFEDKENTFINVSVGISSAITAYSRIHMFNLIHELVKLGYKVYYMDTDSLYVDKSLPPHLIGKGLGLLKLEHIFNEIVFLAPKVYGGKTIDGKEIIKIKGSKNPIKYIKLKELLIKDRKIKIAQEK